MVAEDLTEEISTVKSSNATLHKSMPLISGFVYIISISGI